MKKIIISNYELNYEEKGEGELVVFVHGSVSDYRTWKNQFEEFSKNYHTIVYSRRFHWPNKKILSTEDYSMNQHVDDLEKLLKETGKKANLVGHSYGGFICLLLAMKSPELIRKLILSEPPLITLHVSNIPKPIEIIKLLFTRPKTGFAIINFGVKGIGPATKEVKNDNIDKAIEIFGKATLGREAYAELSKLRKEQVNENVIKSEFIGSGFPKLDLNKIANTNIPTLLLEGENSPKLFSLLLDRLEELLPNSKRNVIPNASHITHEDNCNEYNRLVLSFIK